MPQEDYAAKHQLQIRTDFTETTPVTGCIWYQDNKHLKYIINSFCVFLLHVILMSSDVRAAQNATALPTEWSEHTLYVLCCDDQLLHRKKRYMHAMNARCYLIVQIAQQRIVHGRKRDAKSCVFEF